MLKLYMGIKKVSYGTSKIQKLRRISLDQNLMDTLGLSIGDRVFIELDTELEAITITKTRTSIRDQKSARASNS
jgi:hypothetical protein